MTNIQCRKNYITAPGIQMYGLDDILATAIVRACKYFGMEITLKDIKGSSRKREFVMTRQFYCVKAKSITKMSDNSIGTKINRDHATVLHCYKTVRDTLQKEYDKFWTDELKVVKPIDKEPIKQEFVRPFENSIPANNLPFHGWPDR